MFHKPPQVNPVFEDESRKNSYMDSEASDEVTLVKQFDSSASAVSGGEEALEVLQSDSAQLPQELNKELDFFITFLKQPKFNHPLNLDDISKLYQQFYQDFNKKNVLYWNEYYEVNKYKGTELLTKAELADKNDRIKNARSSTYLNNLIIEKLVCNKFYHKIYKSERKLVKDEMNRLANEKFNAKLIKLSHLPITLQNLDLDVDLKDSDQLVSELAPLYKEMFEIRSPTLKLLKFKKIHEAINLFCKKNQLKINGDFYLPMLIFSMMKNGELAKSFNLVLELNFIKNFKNNAIYENNETNSSETGELLYILTNFDACIIYLSNATLADLKLDFPLPMDPDDELLSKPISIDEASLTYCEDYNLIRRSSKNNSVLDYYSSRLQEYALYNADQGIRTIGNAFDSSVRSVFGRFLPVSGVAVTSASAMSDVDKDTLAQIEENFKLKIEDETVISPVSTNSTLNTSNSSGSNSTTQNNASSVTMTSPTPPGGQKAANVQESRNLSLKNISSSVSGAMKQFRPISTSTSSSSLQISEEAPNQAHQRNRSRGTSLVGEVLSQAPIFGKSSSALEHAFEERRSRANSLHNTNTLNLVNQLRKEFKDEGGVKKFDELSVGELRKLYDNYSRIMNG